VFKLTPKIKILLWNGCVNMDLMVNALIVLINNLYLTLHISHLINFLQIRNWNAKESIQHKPNVIIAWLRHKLDMKSIRLVRITSLIRKLCVINAFHQMLLLNVNSIDMLTMFNLWMWIVCQNLSSTGCRRNTWLSRELVFYMATTRKIHIIKTG
jgi:hypothetical protein